MAGNRSEIRSKAPGMSRLSPGSNLPHHLTALGQQTAQAIDLRGTELHQLLPHPVQHQHALLLGRCPDRPRVVRILMVVQRATATLTGPTTDHWHDGPALRRAARSAAHMGTAIGASLDKAHRNYDVISSHFLVGGLLVPRRIPDHVYPRVPACAFVHPECQIAVRTAARRSDRPSRWVVEGEQRRGTNIAAVALANKNARTAWAVLRQEPSFDAAHLPILKRLSLFLGTCLAETSMPRFLIG